MNTEANAKELWCPMTRSAAPITKTTMGPAVNRIHLTDTGHDINPYESQPYATCIASRCAMWRWLPITSPTNGARRFYSASNVNAETEAEAGPRPSACDGWEFCPCPFDGEPAGWIESHESADSRREGYCGLAGNPIHGVAA